MKSLVDVLTQNNGDHIHDFKQCDTYILQNNLWDPVEDKKVYTHRQVKE